MKALNSLLGFALMAEAFNSGTPSKTSDVYRKTNLTPKQAKARKANKLKKQSRKRNNK